MPGSVQRCCAVISTLPGATATAAFDKWQLTQRQCGCRQRRGAGARLARGWNALDCARRGGLASSGHRSQERADDVLGKLMQFSP